jgi:hypothetical protein
MRVPTSSTNEDKKPHGKPASLTSARKVEQGVSTEWLEVQIALRAREISQREGRYPAQSLANWLEAAKEILSEDHESWHTEA